MSIETATHDGRQAADARMVDACTITRPGGAGVFDPDTGAYTNPAGAVVYSGPCEVKFSDALSTQSPEVGGQELAVTRLTLKVPVSATGVRVDDIATITAAVDADLVGRSFRVISGFAGAFVTARRLQVEEVVDA